MTATKTDAPPAKGKPIWMDYADLVLKAAVPLAVLGGTWWVNVQLENRREAQACIDAQMNLIEFVCGDASKACTPSPERTRQIANVASLVKSRCHDRPLPAALTNLAVAVSASGGDADAAGRVAQAAGAVAAAPEVLTAANAPQPSPAAARDTTPPQPNPAPTLYIQYKLPSQLDGAERFRQLVGASTFQGRTIKAPGKEFTPRSGVVRTELRCLSKVDCAAAPALAAYLGGLLGSGPLPVKDISATYGRDGRSRPYEVWFGDDPIQVGGAPPASPA